MIYSVIEKIWNVPASYVWSGRATQSDMFFIMAEHYAMIKFGRLVRELGSDLIEIEKRLSDEDIEDLEELLDRLEQLYGEWWSQDECIVRGVMPDGF